MIFGAHVIVFSRDAEADRSFLAEVLGFDAVDAGGGWLIFALPPAEAAVHPTAGTEDVPTHQLYLMCDDVHEEMRRLEDRGVTCSPVEEARWGSLTRFALPGGSEVGLYQPRHASPVLDARG
jgi:catechol 2,3-dioxygenase-like lactoylglutathione lyase family enzyme